MRLAVKPVKRVASIPSQRRTRGRYPRKSRGKEESAKKGRRSQPQRRGRKSGRMSRTAVQRRRYRGHADSDGEDEEIDDILNQQPSTNRPTRRRRPELRTITKDILEQRASLRKPVPLYSPSKQPKRLKKSHEPEERTPEERTPEDGQTHEPEEGIPEVQTPEELSMFPHMSLK